MQLKYNELIAHVFVRRKAIMEGEVLLLLLATGKASHGFISPKMNSIMFNEMLGGAPIVFMDEKLGL